MEYKHSLELYKLYNTDDQTDDWIDINFNQILMTDVTT